MLYVMTESSIDWGMSARVKEEIGGAKGCAWEDRRA